jgi:multiple sugar transport system substrate-binding protein
MAAEAPETNLEFNQFVVAYEADWVTRDGRVVIDQPLVRDQLIKALDSYTAVYRKGCTPPNSVDWLGSGNNKAFVAQTVILTPNPTLSVPNMVRASRPQDYPTNMATIEWPSGARGQPLAIATVFLQAVVFKVAGHDPLAKQFVRFLVEDGWLAHWLDFVGDRLLPPLPALFDTPFWLTPSDPHRLRSAVQFLTQPRSYSYGSVSGDWRVRRVWTEHVWSGAVERVVTDGITPEQAVDEAIAHIKQLLSE